MNKCITSMVLVAGLALPMSTAYAAEGAATGNGTSTPAGPAGDNSGPTKSGSMGMSKGSMSGGGMSGGGMSNGSMSKGSMTTGAGSRGSATGGPAGGAGRN